MLCCGEAMLFCGDVSSVSILGDDPEVIVAAPRPLLAAFTGDVSAERGLLLNLTDDFLGGGLGGIGERRFFFFLSFSFSSLSLALSFTVELDEDDVSDSRTVDNALASSEALPILLLVTGGRENFGLSWRRRGFA